MNKNNVDWKRVIVVAGALVAFFFGAAYATGQEMLQYYVAHGLISLLSCVFFFAFFWYLNRNFLIAGYEGNFENGMPQICSYFCGKYAGPFFDWFTTFFCYCCFIVMASAGGSVFNQQYGIPVWVGVSLIAVASCFTVALGLSKIVDVIGRMGPFLILMCFIGAIIGIIVGGTSIAEGSKLVATLSIMKVGNNWWQALISDIGFSILCLVAFMAGIGRQEKNVKGAKLGALIGMLFVSVGFVIIIFALLRNIELVWDSQVPLLALMNGYSPTMASVYVFVIFLGVYTTACPMLWTGARRLSREEDRIKYVLITVTLSLLGLIVALALPFNRLLNIVYGICGYVGFFFFFFVVLRNIRDYLEYKTILKEKAKHDVQA